MTFFEMLFVGHLVGDYLLQTGWQATQKAEGRWYNQAILLHCTLYTLACVPALAMFNAPFWFAGVIFVTHWALDRRWLVHSFMAFREGRYGDDTFKPPFWLVIMNDQALHIVVLALLALLV